MKPAHKLKQGGFSLVELSVSLAVIGLLGLLIWRWTVATQAPAAQQSIQAELAEAQAAVEGFVLSQHRLPCPAATRSGLEDCAASDALLLPWSTLGLSPALSGLHYGVNRGGGVDLAALAPATVSPDLGLDLVQMPLLPTLPTALEAPDAVAASAQVSAQIAAAAARRGSVNGLDWCRVLRRYASEVSVAGALSVGHVSASLPVAYILVHAGENGEFDGNNRVGNGGSWRFDLPGRAQDAGYDDRALAVGPADLAARLGCVQRLSAAQAAAQQAFAQYDNSRVMQQYWSLRSFDIDTAEDGVDSAETGVTMAAVNLALSATSAAVGLASAANTEGITAFAVVIQIANIAIATTEVGLAAADLVDAQQALVDAKAKLVATGAYATHSYLTLAQKLGQAITLDIKGINP